ncbi:MAG: tetratricopeptide repeat protein [Phycisphaerae bacterium]|nr:tetratricopeptide repeat protein [Phycisphaerae bacterium]
MKTRSLSSRLTLPLTVMLVLLLVSGCQTPGARTPAAMNWDQTRLTAALQAAEERIAVGKFEQTRLSLEKFAGLPDQRLRLTLARVDIEEGDYVAALERLEAEASGALQTPEYHRLRGVALEGLGRWPEAAEAYGKAYANKPAAHLLIARLEALALSGQIDEARALLARERGRFPGQASLQVLAARLHARAADPEAALTELQTAALAEPDSRDIRRRLAEAYTSAKRYGEACAFWRALVADSLGADERQSNRHRLAECLLLAGRIDEARLVYRVLVLTRPDDEAAQVGLAAASLAAGEPTEALPAAMKVLQQHDSHIDARLIAALCYNRLNQPERAIELLSASPSDDDTHGFAQKLLEHWLRVQS